MFAIFSKTIKEKLPLIIAISIITLLFISMYVGLFPTISKQSTEYVVLLKSFPKAMMEVFGMEDITTFTQLENFVTLELYSFLWPILVTIVALSFGGSSIAGEIEKGTMEILLALPISRIKIFFGKLFAGFIGILIFNIVSVYGIVFMAIIFNVDYKLGNYFYLFMICMLLSFTIFSIATLLSSVFSDKGKGTFITTGLMLFMYVLNVMSTLKESLENLKYLSFFHYFNAGNALAKKEILSSSYIVFPVISILCIIIAVFWFRKRDISV